MSEEPALRWEGRTAGALQARWGAPAVHLFQRVGSTNDVARRLAASGAQAGTVVLAEEQTAGRGRSGREWSSPPGLGLWFSVVVSPVEAASLAILPLRAGLAVAEALDADLVGTTVGIKWPNDLEIGGRKVGGILCEAAWKGSAPAVAVIGVGLNLLHAEDDFPSEIRTRATSLRIASARAPSRVTIADRVVPAVMQVAAAPRALDLRALAARDLLRGCEIRVSDPVTGQPLVQGTGEGTAADGTLRVRTTDGVVPVRSGTVRRCPPTGPTGPGA